PRCLPPGATRFPYTTLFRSIRVDGGSGTVGLTVVLDVPVQGHAMTPGADEAERAADGVAVEPLDFLAGLLNAPGSLVECFWTGGAPCHLFQQRLVAGYEHQAVAVVVAPAAQVDAAVNTVDYGQSDVLFIKLGGGFDIGSRHGDVGQMGQEGDHGDPFKPDWL